MEKWGLNEIREKYLSFYESKEHLRLSSFPLVPKDDPSILLINAGMTPLKPYFTGKKTPPRKRVTTCQKCIRTPDIERVGKTARHGTFFEMLGNFSFGDYFKHEAIAWAWEFSTKVMQMPEDRIWITVYKSDDEAFEIWEKEIGVPKERIVRMGKEDNFWEHGTGPCGPCSELHFDRGEKYGCGKPDCKVGCDCDRFVEFWNLVFTQFDKDEDGNYNPLPNPNIDTGMGLERLAVICQDVNNLFEVDTIRRIMLAISDYTGAHYGDNERADVSLRVITDHIRSTCFMISDGIIPSNEGRGYVLRRLLRRAARHGKLLGVDGPFLYKIADTVFEESKTAYPELLENGEYIKKIIQIEETRFCETIDQGLSVLNGYVEELKAQGKKTLSGADAFKLYDTYGFPLDLTLDILEEQGMDVDQAGFDKEMQNQRLTAKSAREKNADNAWSTGASLSDDVKASFVGYDKTTNDSVVTAILKDGEAVMTASTGDKVMIAAEETAFYAQSGGQTGDTGVVLNDSFTAVVTDTVKVSGKPVMVAEIKNGSIKVGDKVTLKVDKARRMAISRNHSATHLLQKALKEVLGVHVSQSGSDVDDARLRFDFSHFEAMTKDELKEAEKKVNEKILEGLTITKQEMPIEEAKKMGATALFGEKYGDTVRVVTMGDYSMEFCGGTHLDNTAQIGLFKIVSEGGVAAGIRRIEAVTGAAVMEYLYEKEKTLENLAVMFKATPATVAERAAAHFEQVAQMKKELDKQNAALSKAQAGKLLEDITEIGGVSVITANVGGVSVPQMREMIDGIKDKIASVAVVLAAVAEDGKVVFVGNASKDAVAAGVHIGNVIKAVAAVAGGGGGGKPDSAQAGGKFADKVDEALALAKTTIEQQIK